MALYSYVVSMVPPLRARASRSAVAQEGFRWCVGRLLSLCEICGSQRFYSFCYADARDLWTAWILGREMEIASGM